jgi:hypothetical protein
MDVITLGFYDNFDLGVDFAEGHISSNPRNPTQYFSAFNINGTHYSMNGYDWFVNNPSFPTAAGDPVTAYDSLGNLYYETMKNPITGCWIAKSTNNGQNWISSNVTSVAGVDKNWIAADQTNGPFKNYVYTTMTASSGGNFARSTDNGATWTTTFSPATQSLPGMMVCVGPNGATQGGSVYVVTNSGGSFASTYTFYRSTNGGANFTLMSTQNFSNYVGTNVGGRNSVSNMRTRPYPMIAADNSYGPHRGKLYLVYASNEPAGNGNKPDIFCRTSTDGGATFGAEIKVNDDANTQNNHQWHPAIWCDKETGKLYVQWMDTRLTPTSDSADIYATYSTTGGASFAANQRITNAKFRINCPTCGGGGTPAYQGDYNAITSNSKVAMILWADFRAGNFGSYAAYFPDFGWSLTPGTDSINAVNGSVSIFPTITGTKLYTDTVLFSTEISPNPGGQLAVTYPNGNFIPNASGFRTIRLTANNLTPGTYTVTVTAKGPNGTPVHKRTMTLYAAGTVTGVGNNGEIPVSFKLAQNYPNPFNPATRIDYSIPFKTNVKITVFSSVGTKVASYDFPNKEAGNHYVMFNAKNLASGIYYYKLETESFTDTKKMLLIK